MREPDDSVSSGPIGVPHAATLAEAANNYCLVLCEPLIPLPRRAVAEEDLADAVRQHPTWAATLFGGVVSNLVLSLPPSDPWRRLAGRVGNATAGDNAPEFEGAVLPDGERFGTWQSARDIAELVFDEPRHDIALTALAEPLTSGAAALVAFGGYGWQAAVHAANQLHARAVPDSDAAPSQVSYPQRWRETTAARALFDDGTAAVRWAMHRRASYGLLGDMWALRSFALWARRADVALEGGEFDVDVIGAEIAAETLPEPSTDF